MPTATDLEILQTIGISSATKRRVSELWDSGLIRLDLPIIDLQHIWLVALIQELAQESAVENVHPDPDRLKRLLIELVDFATEHFSLEEDLTNRFKYPSHTMHKEQHKHFIDFLDARVKEVKGGNQSSVSTLINFLLDWLTMHIQKEDRQYRDFLVKSNANVREYFQQLIGHRAITVDRGQAALYNIISGRSEVGEILNENVMSNVIKIWNTHSLAVHIPIIDLQHLWLISLVVELDIASKTLANAKRQKIFNKVVMGAMEYTREHFSTEERIMEKFGYAHLTDHIKQHRTFIEMIARRHKENQSGDTHAAVHLVEDLKEWLVSHIAIEDRNIRIGLKDHLTEIQGYVREMINNNELAVKKKQMDLYNQVCGLKKSP